MRITIPNKCPYLLFILIVFFSAYTGNAQKTWDGEAGNGNWSDARNWAPDGIPEATDDVTIGNFDVTVDVNANCNSLIFNEGFGLVSSILLISGTNSLNVQGLTTINAPNENSRSIVLNVANGNFTSGSVLMKVSTNGSAGTRTAILRTNNGAINISGNIDMEAPLGDGRNAISVQGTGTLTIGGNITGGVIRPVDGFPFNASTVIYNAAGSQNVHPATYHHLTLSNSGTKTAVGNLTIRGDWTNNSTFTAAGFTITFSNTNNLQTINGATTFNNLSLQKNGHTLIINDDITINGTLSFSSGLISSNPASRRLVIFAAGAKHENPAQPSQNKPFGAFISGPVRKLGATDFTFPVGKDTLGKQMYVPFSINNLSGESTFTGEYFPVSAHKIGVIGNPGIKQISNCEYWNLSRDAGFATPDVILFWGTSNSCSGTNYISKPEDIIVARFNVSGSGAWDVYSGGGDGSTQIGSVGADTISVFGPLTFGTKSLSNALPIVFANITATQREGDVAVSFSNLTEEKVASYHVERSADGVNFEAIGTLEPRLNNNGRADYTYMDRAPYNGANYYRIRGVETTGKIIYSAVVHLQAIGKAADLIIYPNPAHTNSALSVQMGDLPAGKYLLRVFNQQGQLLHTAQFGHGGGFVSTPLPASGLSAGRYILELNGAIKRTKSFLLQ